MTAMSGDTHREVSIERLEKGRFRATNARGATLDLGGGEADFSPVELLLTAIAGCSALDVDALTSKRAEAVRFRVVAGGEKIRDGAGANRLIDLVLDFDVAFPDGDDGDAARAVLPDAMAKSHDRLCTVTRTVEDGTEVGVRDGDGRHLRKHTWV
jgi:uncharacterized OsmC-like protein